MQTARAYLPTHAAYGAAHTGIQSGSVSLISTDSLSLHKDAKSHITDTSGIDPKHTVSSTKSIAQNMIGQ